MVPYFGQEIKSLEIQMYQRIINPKCKDYRKWKRILLFPKETLKLGGELNSLTNE